MFFYIGENTPLLNKTHTNLFLDDGWDFVSHNDNLFWTKGYSTECAITTSVTEISKGYVPRGLWTVIHYDGLIYKVYHSLLRGYPLYFKDEEVTNLPNLEGFQRHINVPEVLLNNDPLSLDDAVNQIQNILEENILGFHKYNDAKLNVLFSGGLDTTTVWALIDKLSIPYDFDVSISNIKSPDLLKSIGRIREYETPLTEHISKNVWSYEITSLRKNTNWYSTGFYSEIMTLRSMSAFAIIAGYYNKTVYDFINETDYVYSFLERKRDIFDKIHKAPEDEISLKERLVKLIFSDYQMWHIDNNFHFSPFYDIRIAEVAYRLSIEDLIINSRHGLIHKMIIEKTNPNLLKVVSDKKNTGNVMLNFIRNLPTIKFPKDTKKTFR